ncbi:MAG: ATP-binding protein [Candidatus Heimdallarchaeaceae archaeon]
MPIDQMKRISSYPNYIREFLIKSFANQSNVAIIETNDPKRLEEFQLLISKEFHHVYLFDLKNGLRKIIQGKKESKLTIKDDFTGTENKITNLVAAIETYEKTLDLFLQQPTSQSSILICNLDIVSEAEVSILRIIASENRYFEQDAHIVLFVPSLSIFPLHFRNMCIEIDVELSTLQERSQILDTILKSFDIKKANKEQVTKQLAGLNLHEVNTVLLESVARSGDISLDIVSHFKEHMLKKLNVELTEKEQLGFNAVGGYEVVKKYITKRILKPLKAQQYAKQMGMDLPKGLLFMGPPGTGKSLFAKAIAKELEIPIIELQTRNFLSKYVGESESNLKRILKVIDEMKPCVVFIDEIDSLGKRGGTGENDGGTMSRIFGQLLSWMNDQEGSIVIGTTNEIERMDQAMLRPGRFDKIIPVLYPDVAARLEIFKVHTQIKRSIPLAELDFETLAKETEFFTGAEIEALVKDAVGEAVEEDAKQVTIQHFARALENFTIDHNQRTTTMQRYMQLARKYCRDKRFIAELEQEQRQAIDRVELVKKRLEART